MSASSNLAAENDGETKTEIRAPDRIAHAHSKRTDQNFFTWNMEGKKADLFMT